MIALYLLLGLGWSICAQSLIPLAGMLIASGTLYLLLTKKDDPNNHPTPPPQVQGVEVRNPMPLGDYYHAVNSVAPAAAPGPDDALKRLYSAPGTMPEGLYTNPIPDPTLMARTPFFWQSSEVDRNIVADQGNLRFIR